MITTRTRLDPADTAAALVAHWWTERPTATPHVVEVAAWLGVLVVHAPRARLRGHSAHVQTIAGRDVVSVRRGLSPEAEAHAIAHELGHVVIGLSHGLDCDGLEAWCDDFAAALVARISDGAESSRPAAP